jgi:hypothetical protein
MEDTGFSPTESVACWGGVGLQRSVVLEVPGVGDAVVEDGAAAAVVEEEGEVLALDGVAPPFVFDDPGVLDAFDLVIVAIDDEFMGKSLVVGRDGERYGLVQGS